MTAAGSRWVLPDQPAPIVVALAAELGKPAWFAQMLIARGVTTASSAAHYLQPTLDDLHDPLLLLGMQTAVARVLRAVAHRETILIYGDYDVDGTTATVLLKTAIDRISPVGDSLVRYHIPHRIREGYGMQQAVLGQAAAAGVRLVISVDTGIRAFAAADEARLLGLDLIVTDHHLPDAIGGMPDALAVINPNQPGCAYPFKELCGAAVAFKLAHALLAAAAAAPGCRPVDPVALRDKLLPSLLKLVAIATVADAVALRDENRVLVALGLRELREPRQHGLRALMELAGVTIDRERGPTATEISFRVAPRINAAGRMDVASDVVQMLLTRDAAEGRALAEKLHGMNEERRGVEAEVLLALETQMTALRASETALAGCLVLDGEGWHRGVIGILASRVVERMGRPALVIVHQDGEAHGSGRSIAGFHLLDAITAAHGEGDMFHRFGGHAHAVGFSLPSDRVPLLRQRLAIYAQDRVTAEMTTPTVTIDAELKAAELNADLLQLLHTLEPFGHGNHEPTFVVHGLCVAEEPRVLKERHIKLRLRGHDGTMVDALGWSRAVLWPERLAVMRVTQGSVVDIAFRVSENRHPVYGGPQMEMCDLRLAVE